jgi:hypothetical protein
LAMGERYQPAFKLSRSLGPKKGKMSLPGAIVFGPTPTATIRSMRKQ